MLTLDLLFPANDPDTEMFLKNSGHLFFRIKTPVHIAISHQQLDFSNFACWCNSLEELHEVYVAPPKSNLQLWRDRRNRKDFWSLVISIIALSLALGLGITGVVNAQSANSTQKEALHLAERSFRLACAQADQDNINIQQLCS